MNTSGGANSSAGRSHVGRHRQQRRRGGAGRRGTVHAAVLSGVLALSGLAVVGFAAPAGATALPFPGGWSVANSSVPAEGAWDFPSGSAGVIPAPPGGGTYLHFTATKNDAGDWSARVNASMALSVTAGKQYVLAWDEVATPGSSVGDTVTGGAPWRGSLPTVPDGTWQHKSATFVSPTGSVAIVLGYTAESSGTSPEGGIADMSLVQTDPAISGPSSVAVTEGAGPVTVDYPVTAAGGCALTGAAVPSWATVALDDSFENCVLTLDPSSGTAGTYHVGVEPEDMAEQPFPPPVATTITVRPVLDHLVLTPPSATVPAGGARTYQAEGIDPGGVDLGDVTSATTFTISGGGSCTGATCTSSVVGNHTITGTDGAATGAATLTVTPAALDHLVLSPATATVAAGGNQSYTAQGFDRFGNSLGDVTSATTFTVSGVGSCSGASCTSTVAGAHTITGTDGGATGTASLSVAAAALDHLVVSPASAAVAAGDSQSYTAEGVDRFGNDLGDVTSATTFTISGVGSCTGASCTSSVVGGHTVTGTDGTATGDAVLTVTPAALDHLVLSPATATVTAGGSQAYTAEGFDRFGNSRGDVTSATTFTVSGGGSCTGASCTSSVVGDHTITGTDAAATGTATLAVGAATLDHLVVAPPTATVTAGGSQAYTAEGFDRFGNDLGDVTSSTTFTISGGGRCTGASCTSTVAGAHMITGTDGGATGTGTLDVTGAGLDRLVVSPSSPTVTAGDSQAYTAEGLDRFGNDLGDVTSSTTFTISGDGRCTAASCTSTVAGDHTITGTDAAATGTATLSVVPGAPDHLGLSPATATTTAGTGEPYSTHAYDGFGNVIPALDDDITVRMSPDGSCTPAPAVTCTATKAGAHSVVATGGGREAAADLTVGPAALARIALAPASGQIVAGTSQTYTATGFDAYGNPLGDITAVPALGTTFSIAPNGTCSGATCTADRSGGHTVTVTAGARGPAATTSAEARSRRGAVAVTATARLAVTPAALSRLVLTPAHATVRVGHAETYEAAGFDRFGNDRGDVTSATTFTIAGGSCAAATCTPNEAGSHIVTGRDGAVRATAVLSATRAAAVPTAPVATQAATAPTAPLATTGSDLAALLGVAMLLLLTGGALELTTRRRRC